MSNECNAEQAAPASVSVRSISSTTRNIGENLMEYVLLARKESGKRVTNITVSLFVEKKGDDQIPTLVSITHRAEKYDHRANFHDTWSFTWNADAPDVYNTGHSGSFGQSGKERGSSTDESHLTPLTHSFDPEAVLSAMFTLSDAHPTQLVEFLAVYLPEDLGLKMAF